jgi:hypothetical protein
MSTHGISFQWYVAQAHPSGFSDGFVNKAPCNNFTMGGGGLTKGSTVTRQEVIWIFRSCENDFVLGFWFLFWVVVNFQSADDEVYVSTIC